MSENTKITDVFPKLKLSEKLEKELENVLVEKANYYKKDRIIKILMVSTEIVNSKVFDELEKIIYQQLLGNTDAKLYIIPKFNLQNNLNALDIIEK